MAKGLYEKAVGKKQKLSSAQLELSENPGWRLLSSHDIVTERAGIQSSGLARMFHESLAFTKIARMPRALHGDESRNPFSHDIVSQCVIPATFAHG